MKKILVIQPIHEAGIELLNNNLDYEFEIVENVDPEFLKSKIKDCDGASIRTAKLSGDVRPRQRVVQYSCARGNVVMNDLRRHATIAD